VLLEESIVRFRKLSIVVHLRTTIWESNRIDHQGCRNRT